MTRLIWVTPGGIDRFGTLVKQALILSYFQELPHPGYDQENPARLLWIRRELCDERYRY